MLKRHSRLDAPVAIPSPDEGFRYAHGVERRGDAGGIVTIENPYPITAWSVHADENDRIDNAIAKFLREHLCEKHRHQSDHDDESGNGRAK